MKIVNVEESVTDRFNDAFRLVFYRTYRECEIRCNSCSQIINRYGRRGIERKNTTKKQDGGHRFTVRFGADVRRNDRSDLMVATSDSCVLEISEEGHRVDSASISDICQQGIVSCGVHYGGGGGDFMKNRCGVI